MNSSYHIDYRQIPNISVKQCIIDSTSAYDTKDVSMQLFDTLRGHKATLAIPTDRPLTLYVCGVTPYDTTHIGHAHTFLIFDKSIFSI